MKICAGFWVCLLFLIATGVEAVESDSTEQRTRLLRKSRSLFPILMYDSDVGVGMGGKAILKNYLGRQESFDLLLFYATKGEQSVTLVTSFPDREIRQGAEYPLAVDVELAFGKSLLSNFFGFGNKSEDNEWQFPRETASIEFSAGRGFTEQVVGEIGVSYLHNSVYDYEGENPLMHPDVPGAGESDVSLIAAGLRWDTRDSYINPHRGINIEAAADVSSEAIGSDFDFQRFFLKTNGYWQLWSPNNILAARFWAQHVRHTAPYFLMSTLGGGGTLRGFKVERFVDHAMTLVSVEYRFPVYGKLGGVLFMDSGRVYPTIRDVTLKDWHNNVGVGLRYYLTNFVVRADIGSSDEDSRVFFNFGHVF